MGGVGFGKPPEGAIVGENVPRQNEAEERREALIEEITAELKLREPYSDYSRNERKAKAQSIVENIPIRGDY